ncbi:hypothetical protein J6590_060812, partial [Homalodisca vitripennis]
FVGGNPPEGEARCNQGPQGDPCRIFSSSTRKPQGVSPLSAPIFNPSWVLTRQCVTSKSTLEVRTMPPNLSLVAIEVKTNSSGFNAVLTLGGRDAAEPLYEGRVSRTKISWLSCVLNALGLVAGAVVTGAVSHTSIYYGGKNDKASTRTSVNFALGLVAMGRIKNAPKSQVLEEIMSDI